MVLFDTGCSDQLVSPTFAQWLIAKGARWRYCDPLPMEHGNKAATRAAAPADKQVCMDVFLVHQGHQYLQKDVWFYIYEGTLPDAMLSDGFLQSIPCISEPGRRLLDTSSGPTDDAQVRNHVNNLRQNYDDIVAYHMSRCSDHPPATVNASIAGQAARFSTAVIRPDQGAARGDVGAARAPPRATRQTSVQRGLSRMPISSGSVSQYFQTPRGHTLQTRHFPYCLKGSIKISHSAPETSQRHHSTGNTAPS